MPDLASFLIGVTASGDTTADEVDEVTDRLKGMLREQPNVEDIASVPARGPEGAKAGSEIAAFGAFVLQLAPSAIEPILNLVREFLSLRGAPIVKISVKVKDKETKIEFNPKRTSSSDMTALVRELTDIIRS
jgi:hypothetical protein